MQAAARRVASASASRLEILFARICATLSGSWICRNRFEAPGPAAQGAIENDQPLGSDRRQDLAECQRIAERGSAQQRGQRLDLGRHQRERVRQKGAGVGQLEGRHEQSANGLSAIDGRLRQAGNERLVGAFRSCPNGGDRQELSRFSASREALDDEQARGVRPVEILEQQHDRNVQAGLPSAANRLVKQ